MTPTPPHTHTHTHTQYWAMRLRSMLLWSHKVSSRHSAVWMCKFRPLFQSEICMYMHTITPPQGCPSQNGCWWSLQCDWQIPHRHICREKAYWTKTNPFFTPRRESKHRGIWVSRQAGERERERREEIYSIHNPPTLPSLPLHPWPFFSNCFREWKPA